VEIAHAPSGSILDVGRRTRTIPPAIRRALEARDRGCRFPGCGSRFTDAHHVVHWADGGATKLDNLILLCHYHHRLLHEEGFHLELNPWPGGRPVFYDRRGVPVPETPTVTGVGPRSTDGAGRFRGNVEHGEGLPDADRVEVLIAENRRLGADPDWRTASGVWKREADIPRRVLDGVWKSLGRL
jgi:hypothetical protein